VGITIFNEAVVVLAQDHNPTILHPSFLASQSIVPEDWELAEPPLCTPPLSVVKYSNGIVFTVESNKLQVAKSPATSPLRESPIPQYASRYVEKLPHVRYIAVGVNFSAVLEDAEPSRQLIGRFLTEGAWNAGDLALKELSLRLVYSANGGILNLSCSPGSVLEASTGLIVKGVILNANYHFTLPGGNPLEEAVDAMMKFPHLGDHFIQVVKTIFSIAE